MQPRVERAASTALLTIHGDGGTWGIPSTAIASVQRWAGNANQTPVELLSLLGVATPNASQQHARVLVLEVQGERLSLLVHGALQLAETAADDLLPLPAAVQSLTPLVSHVAVIGGKPALFVVSPERLLEAARHALTPDDSAAR
jgi:chemotaxis signal transduction protein